MAFLMPPLLLLESWGFLALEGLPATNHLLSLFSPMSVTLVRMVDKGSRGSKPC